MALRALACALFALTGLGLALPGGWLILLGGSPYYFVSGLVLMATAVLLFLRRREAIVVHIGLLVATLAWGLWEVGLDAWALLPRLGWLAAIVVPLLASESIGLPPARSRPARIERRALLLLALAACGLIMALLLGHSRSQTLPAPAATSAPEDGQWPVYAKSADGSHYSGLHEIDAGNVRRLTQAWRYELPAERIGGKVPTVLQVTPLMVDGRLFGCTDTGTVFALDPVTGRQLWRHDRRFDGRVLHHSSCRGVTYYRAPRATECPTRILAGTIDAHLIALDAVTGAVCSGFGRSGEIDLLEGLARSTPDWIHPTSPPLIVNGVAVVGSHISDNMVASSPPGVVRGYDAITGRLRWAFDPAHPETQGAPAGGQYGVSTPNAWGLLAGDPRLGLVYLPMGNTGPDPYGATRNRDAERFATAIVALDAATGAIRWRFQAVHHDLWDFDFAAQPLLVDVDGKPALIAASKDGQLFVLDRRNGHPLARVEERPVPPSPITGETAAPTQPYSPDMPDFSGGILSEADMWGLTPFDQLECRILFRRSRYQGQFTPPSTEPTIYAPGKLGGVNWGGIALDRARDVMFVTATRLPFRGMLVPRVRFDAGERAGRTEVGYDSPMRGTPFGVHAEVFRSSLRLPCVRPPYGTLTAVDLHGRRILWTRSIGDTRRMGPMGHGSRIPLVIGINLNGGPLVTAGGLVFIAGTSDMVLRALDETSGETLWQAHLSGAGDAAPMTYRAADGHQYVVIAATVPSAFASSGGSINAFRLRD